MNGHYFAMSFDIIPDDIDISCELTFVLFDELLLGNVAEGVDVDGCISVVQVPVSYFDFKHVLLNYNGPPA